MAATTGRVAAKFEQRAEQPRIRVSYDQAHGVAYLHFSYSRHVPPHAETVEIDPSRRLIDYAADGTVVGIELLNTRVPVKTADLPYSELVTAALRAHGIQVLEPGS